MFKKNRITLLWIGFSFTLCMAAWLVLSFILNFSQIVMHYEPHILDKVASYFIALKSDDGQIFLNLWHLGWLSGAVAISLWLAYVITYYLRLNRTVFRYRQPQIIKYLTVFFGTIFAIGLFPSVVVILIYLMGLILLVIGAILHLIYNIF